MQVKYPVVIFGDVEHFAWPDVLRTGSGYLVLPSLQQNFFVLSFVSLSAQVYLCVSTTLLSVHFSVAKSLHLVDIFLLDVPFHSQCRCGVTTFR